MFNRSQKRHQISLRIVKFELKSAVHWFDTGYKSSEQNNNVDRVDLARCLSLVVLHLGCLGVIWVGWSWFAVTIAIALYFIRMFSVTAFLHRYFSHRSFKTSRFMQFIFAVMASTALQRGALWWASHHRKHHQQSDSKDDVHSPNTKGFVWSHIGWLTSTKNFATDYTVIKDFAKFPELVFLNRYNKLVPALMALGLYFLGAWAASEWPILQTSGTQVLIWGFFISTTVLFHGTSTINSLAHIFGNQRFKTGDQSRNNFWLTLITLGEGWHNNHHHYMYSARQGFYWWEIDLTYYLLKLLSFFGIIWDIRTVSNNIRESNKIKL